MIETQQRGKHEAARSVRRKCLVASVLVGAAIGLHTGAALAQSGKPVAKPLLQSAKDQPIEAFGGYGGGAQIPEPVIPAGVDTFNLTLEETKLYSRSLNFEVVGHSYFRGPWLAPFALQHGLGAGFNTLRVYDGILYGAGYGGPPTLFGTLIADVRDPTNMQPLSFVPCNPGTRCVYLRVNNRKHILVSGQDTNSSNPTQPSGPAQAGVAFTDVSDPANPQPLGFVLTRAGGATHGFDIDDRYAYTCATTPLSKSGVGSNHELVIVDYDDPRNPKIVSTLHIQGQHILEEYGPMDQPLADGMPQVLWCHEVFYLQDRLYIAWRDAGMIIVDVTDRTNPQIISRLDYVPPFSGEGGGAAHSSVPVIVDPNEYPTLLVNTDELFGCPGGFGRLMDISELQNPQIVSSFRVPYAHDNFNYTTDQYVCPPGGAWTSHLPVQDFRSPSLWYTSWYSLGLRTWDFSNPFLPREVGFYYSPPYPCGEFTSNCGVGNFVPTFRQNREQYQDPTTGLIYVGDGNGGGVTVVRWTGQIPRNPPLPTSQVFHTTTR